MPKWIAAGFVLYTVAMCFVDGVSVWVLALTGFAAGLWTAEAIEEWRRADLERLRKKNTAELVKLRDDLRRVNEKRA